MLQSDQSTTKKTSLDTENCNKTLKDFMLSILLSLKIECFNWKDCLITTDLLQSPIDDNKKEVRDVKDKKLI